MSCAVTRVVAAPALLFRSRRPDPTMPSKPGYRRGKSKSGSPAVNPMNNFHKQSHFARAPPEYDYQVPKYSIVVPFHNEEDNVTTLYDRLKAVMEYVNEPFELVFVDDGSRDRTYRLLEEIAAVDSRVLVVKLRRNFGQTSALAAGFDHAQGEYILAMDGDLQHNPTEIPQFLAKLEEGLRCRQRLARRARRQLHPSSHPIRRGQQAHGRALRRRYSRLRHHFQGVSPRGHPEHPALRRDAPVHPRARLLVRRQHLRDSPSPTPPVRQGSPTTASPAPSASSSIS